MTAPQIGQQYTRSVHLELDLPREEAAALVLLVYTLSQWPLTGEGEGVVPAITGVRELQAALSRLAYALGEAGGFDIANAALNLVAEKGERSH